MSEKKRVHCGPVIPLCDDISDVKVFIFGDLWWPRLKENRVPEYEEWAIYWATPAFLRRYGVGVSGRVRNSIERESRWREQNEKFKHGLNQLCAMLLEADFIERAVVHVEQERRQVVVEISKWFKGREARLRVAWYNFYDVVSDNFLDRVEYDFWVGREKLKFFENQVLEEVGGRNVSTEAHVSRTAGRAQDG